MRVLRGRNVNALFRDGLELLHQHGVREQSRAGEVLVVDCPVVSVYERPMERVLFCVERDANPFFHLMEGLWMLAGRDDAAFLNNYIRDFGSRYSDDGVIHGAYGRRWRSALGFDQLEVIVAKLRKSPQDRQCVLQMWDGVETFEHDGKRLGFNDLLGDWKDRPCNTHVYFRVRDIVYRDPPVTDENSAEWEARIAMGGDKVLDMTICCRSNDAVWGAHGANAVHFSMLQEYVAGRVGCGIGTMFQFSNNYHGYVGTLDKIGDPMNIVGSEPYDDAEVHAVTMASDWSKWDADLTAFMSWHDDVLWQTGRPLEKTFFGFANEWFRDVAGRVALARWQWVNAQKVGARHTAEQIAAPDWRRACLEWMDRRKKCGS